MASEYYGLKGNLVKKYQEVLNSLGANLKVSGSWGKKTENAYLQYRDRFQDILTGAPAIDTQADEDAPLDNPYETLVPPARTEAQLRDAAEDAKGTAYDAQMEQLERAARDEEEDVRKQLAQLDASYESRLGEIQEQYKRQRQELSDAALKRGMGRSSYVTDQISGSQKRETASFAALGEDKAARQSEPSDKVARLRSDYGQTSARLLNEREKSILAAIDEYRKADASAAAEATKYNNSMLMQAREEAEEKRRFEREQEQARRDAQNRVTIAMMK